MRLIFSRTLAAIEGSSDGTGRSSQPSVADREDYLVRPLETTSCTLNLMLQSVAKKCAACKVGSRTEQNGIHVTKKSAGRHEFKVLSRAHKPHCICVRSASIYQSLCPTEQAGHAKVLLGIDFHAFLKDFAGA